MYVVSLTLSSKGNLIVTSREREQIHVCVIFLDHVPVRELFKQQIWYIGHIELLRISQKEI